MTRIEENMSEHLASTERLAHLLGRHHTTPAVALAVIGAAKTLVADIGSALEKAEGTALADAPAEWSLALP